jgi:MFS family permease
LLGIGFQVHSSLNAAPQYLRFAKPADLEMLLPIFWVGFNVLMLCASPLTKRYGGVVVMGIAGCVGAVAAGVAASAGSLNVLMAAQFVAGGECLNAGALAMLRHYTFDSFSRPYLKVWSPI